VDAPPKKGTRERVKPYVRAKPERIDVNYRMAYVGTVTVVDKEGDGLNTRRYGASANEGPEGILQRMMADIRSTREQSNLPVGLMQDAAPEMWTLMRNALKEQAGVSDWLEGVDRYHLDERLAEILRTIERDGDKRRKKLEEWTTDLNEDDAAIDRIHEYLTLHIPGTTGDAREKLECHQTFLTNNKDRMRYATLRLNGLPCGSGATEGACKSLAQIRTKGCGQRWHDQGVNAVLTLRALEMSERLDPFWSNFAPH
jgi:hypothetical protein